ncbi:hypothetical protein BDV37DRAFT_247079 [Aspergillus pseudonomiae]|uniref:Uncharacterized protein n=1 Tax=Aspergillus pseudonomiae TaxID=1506151 RepID=A0A5N7DEB7_9EURO|nr:uncharacterized protein BDV37DRAFT_247079 [Aspergillus pseudonomiae]KAE8404589.1 hypothetical protein BDV37DRAFT_247079 [Aspergillus pseudonomiae]
MGSTVVLQERQVETHSKNNICSSETRFGLFHSECATCSSIYVGSPCVVCRHLRLMHIV